MVQTAHSLPAKEWPSTLIALVVRTPGPIIGLAVALLYFASAQYVIFLNDPVYAGAGFWPPAGITLAALLTLPRQRWLWVLGAVAAAEIGGAALHAYPLLASLPWAVGNTLEPLVAALLLVRLGGGGRLTPVRNLLWFLLFGVLIGPAVGALIGGIGTTLAFGKPYLTVVTKWIIGDGLGVLVVAPLLLSLREWHPVASKKWEAGLLSLLVALVTGVAFYPWNTEWDVVLPYLTAPMLIWAGMRFGAPGAAAAGFITAQGANLATGLGFGPLGMATSPEGHTITLLQVFVAILLTTGLVVAALATELINRSAVERTLNEQAEKLKQSEARLRDYAEVASDWLWETDEQFRFTRFEGNNHVGRGGLKDRMIGRTRWESAGASMQTAEWQEHIRLHEVHEPFRDFTYSVADENGRTWHLRSSGRPVFNSEGQFLGYRGASTDLTERRSLEAQLQQAQKMEVLGQLTGGIAHDFNNLLTVVIGNIEILTEGLSDPAARQPAEIALGAAGRAADLTQKLLSFGRRQSLQPERLDIDQIVGDIGALLKRTLGEHIHLNIDVNSASRVALVDRTLLESALLNLALNARDAMPQGGTLTVTTGETIVSEDSGCLKAGERAVTITVMDTGSGMTPAVLERAFEPFFTTKDVGKGSGLGLSMVYGFAQQSGGHVTIHSQEQVGTSVTIFLPTEAKAEVAHQVREVPLQQNWRGRERVLLVEDEPEVLQFAANQLRNLGYEVTPVVNAHQGLAALRGSMFDLLLTDIVLPRGMSGVELAWEAKKIAPQIKVLFASGYAEDAFQQHGRLKPGTVLMRKPFRRRELAKSRSGKKLSQWSRL